MNPIWPSESRSSMPQGSWTQNTPQKPTDILWSKRSSRGYFQDRIGGSNDTLVCMNMPGDIHTFCVRTGKKKWILTARKNECIKTHGVFVTAPFLVVDGN